MAVTGEHVLRQIRHWAKVAGGDQIHRLGYAALEAIRGADAANDSDYGDYGDDAIADGIGRILERMALDGWPKEALVLRVHYLSEALSESERLARVSRKGLPISRAAYYIYLNTAHAYVSAALSFGDRTR